MKLPLNCEAEYIPDFLTDDESSELLEILINDYQLDKARLCIEAGNQLIETDSIKILFVTENLKASNSFPENVHGRVYEWKGIFQKLREKVENHCKNKFEIAMCIYYPDGSYFAPFHYDQTTSGHRTMIPSLSLGAQRKFIFKKNESNEEYSVDLSNGSLLLMKDYCQDRYTHSLPKSTTCKTPRINITFREVGFQ
ncbi:MAG: alpha-ketoglutarate-dependent dioxygenase AlkB [Bacteroidota bacterium]